MSPKHIDKHNITAHYTKAHSASAAQFIFYHQISVGEGIKRGQQWADHRYHVMLTYNNTMVHSDSEDTPQCASKQDNQLDVNVTLKVRANNTRIYPALAIGNKVILAPRNDT